MSYIQCTSWRRYVAALIGCSAAALSLAAVGASARTARFSSVPACSSAQTEVWLGLGLGGGTAGTTYFPLEFSNISRHTCSFSGYPGVSAFRGALHQIGPAATRNHHAHTTVTLAPGQSAHALLGVIDSGAVCSRSVRADGLKVFGPGQRIAQEVPYSFPACAHRGVLTVGPLHAGVGIPGHTGP